MNLAEKHKATLKAADCLWALPNEEVEAIVTLIEHRKKLHQSLYGASLNRKSGASEQKFKTELRGNAQEIRDWSAKSVANADSVNVEVDEGNGTW